MERWWTGRLFARTRAVEVDWHTLATVMPDLVEVPDTGVADEVQTIRHGLGRVPKGIVIVNMSVPDASGVPVHWYREYSDPAWTSKQISVRFTVAGASVLLGVF